MTTETLKIKIAKRILDINDNDILQRIDQFIQSEHLIDFNETSKQEFEKQMDEQQERMNKGKANFYSISEVREKIINENNL